MKANIHLASARGFSIVLLLMAYLAVDLADFSLRRGNEMESLQRWVARVLVNDVLYSQGVSPLSGENIQSALEAGKLHVELSEALGFKNVKIVDIIATNSQKTEFNLTISYLDGNGEKNRRDLQLPAKNIQPLELIKQKARLLKIDLTGKTIADIVDEIESELMTRQVALPWMPVELSQVVALRVLFIGAFLVVTLIHSRVSAIYHDPELALEEPWLVLDARSVIEKLVGGLWLFLLLITPWLISGCLISTLIVESGHVKAPGNLVVEILGFIGLVGLTMASGWQSLRIVGMTMELHAARALLRSTQSQA